MTRSDNRQDSERQGARQRLGSRSHLNRNPTQVTATEGCALASDSRFMTGVDLYWVPLGAGGHFVRLNGRMFEAVVSRLEHRPAFDLYHSALEARMPEGRFVIEQTPVSNGDGARRGVAAGGAVGTRWAGHFRIFRYEVRRWRDGVIPDVSEAVDSPRRLTDDAECARRLLDLVPSPPDAGLGSGRAGNRRNVELQLGDRVADRQQRSEPGLDPSAGGWPRAGLERWARGGASTTVTTESAGWPRT